MPTLEYAMTIKERLHHLVDALPESEVPTATRILEALVATADPVLRAHLLAPEDDESTAGDDDDGGLTEARAESSLSHEVELSPFDGRVAAFETSGRVIHAAGGEPGGFARSSSM
jgi:hypothetical protein